MEKRAEEEMNTGKNDIDLEIKFDLDGGFYSNLDENKDSDVNEIE